MVILTKRRKFVLTSFFLSGGLFFLETVSFEWKYQAIAGLSLLAGILTYWSLRGAAFNLAAWVTPILPIFFTAGVGLFYFLLPSSFWTVIPIISIYFLGMYALLLTENIFSVSAIRTISLFRAASAVGFLLTLTTAFFLYNSVLSLKLPSYFNFLACFLFSFPLSLSGLWSTNLEERISSELLLGSLALSFFMAELALASSFWPMGVTVGSLFLTSCLYVLLGLAQAFLSGRLFKRTIIEYLSVGLVVFAVVLIYTQWG